MSYDVRKRLWQQVEKVFEISGILKIIPLIKNNEENVG